jgi:hypothetical protein
VSACCVQLTAKLADSKSFEAVKESHDNFLGKALSSRSVTHVQIRSELEIKVFWTLKRDQLLSQNFIITMCGMKF